MHVLDAQKAVSFTASEASMVQSLQVDDVRPISKDKSPLYECVLLCNSFVLCIESYEVRV